MNERITIRVTAEMKEALERFHQDQVAPLRSRQDAFRHIIEDWLTCHGYLPQSSGNETGLEPGDGKRNDLKLPTPSLSSSLRQ